MSANEQNFAFPRPSFGPNEPANGLTKREYFAAMALNGLTSNLSEWVSEESFSKFAEQAFSFADAMIKESEKRHAK